MEATRLTKHSQQKHQQQSQESCAGLRAMLEYAIVTTHRLDLEADELSAAMDLTDNLVSEQLRGLADELCDGMAERCDDGDVGSRSVEAVSSRVAEGLQGLNDRDLRMSRAKVDGPLTRHWQRARALDALTAAIADAERAMRVMMEAVDAVAESMAKLRRTKAEWTVDADVAALRRLARADGAGGVIEAARQLDASVRKTWQPVHASGLSVEDEVVRRVVTAAAETDRVGAVEAAVVAAVRRPDTDTTTTVDGVERLLRMDRMMMDDGW